MSIYIARTYIDILLTQEFTHATWEVKMRVGEAWKKTNEQFYMERNWNTTQIVPMKRKNPESQEALKESA